MSIPALNWCIEQKSLPPGEWVVLFHLCHAHNQVHGCFPSQDFLAEQTNMSKRSIVRHIGALEAAGLVIRKRRFNSVGERISDRYIMPFEPGFASENQPSANLASGQSVHDQVPNGAQNVHEMAPKQEVTVREQEEPPLTPPPTNTKKKLAAVAPDGFEEFWAGYPRQVAKPKARAAYAKALSKAPSATILSAMLVYAESRRGEDPQFTAHPATWLNGERWNDKIEIKTGGPNGKPDRLSAMLRGAASSPLDRGAGCYPPQPLLARG